METFSFMKTFPFMKVISNLTYCNMVCELF